MRLQKFHKLTEHYWYKNVIKKLTAQEINICLDFLKQNEVISVMEYEKKVDQYFMDKSKTKNWILVTELLSICK